MFSKHSTSSFGFEVEATQYGLHTANGRAQYAIDLLNSLDSIEYQDAVLFG